MSCITRSLCIIRYVMFNHVTRSSVNHMFLGHGSLECSLYPWAPGVRWLDPRLQEEGGVRCLLVSLRWSQLLPKPPPVESRPRRLLLRLVSTEKTPNNQYTCNKYQVQIYSMYQVMGANKQIISIYLLAILDIYYKIKLYRILP